MTFCILCGINSKHSDIYKKKGGVHIKNYHQIICHTQWWHHKCHNIGCDDDEEEKVDSDDMEYTEDAIDNMNLEFSGD
jgi:hypothetical protein